MKLLNVLSLDFGKILSYGLPGLCVIFILLAYLLLRKEQDQKEPRATIIKAIYVFLSITFGMAIIVGIFSLPILTANTTLKQAVNIAEEVNEGFVKVGASDSLAIETLKTENEFLKGQLASVSSSNPVSTDKDELQDFVENQENVLQGFEDKKVQVSNPKLKVLQSKSTLLKRKIETSDFNKLGSKDKSKILNEVAVLNKQTLDFTKQVNISERAMLTTNLNKFNTIQKTLKK